MRPPILIGTLFALSAGLAAGLAPDVAAAQAGKPPSQPEARQADESALRYYASLGQTARVTAETRRLQRLYSDWQPPSDLGSVRQHPEDEAPYWDLLAEGRLADVRAALATRERSSPGWRPSEDLLAAIRRRELRTALIEAAKAGLWTEALGLATEAANYLDGADAEFSWTAAEVLSRGDRRSDAAAILRRVMDNPRATPAERSATIQHALADLSMADAEQLIALERHEGGVGEFDAIRIDITRARLVARLRDTGAAEIPAADWAAFQDFARTTTDPSQPALVAWDALRDRRNEDALTWFKLSISRGGDAMVAHGLAHTLHALGYDRDAEEVAYAWREPLINNTIVFTDVLEAALTMPVPPAIEPARLERYAQVTLETTSGEGAQALAWYAYNTCQFDTALDWFRRAVAWHPKEATVYGYALALRRAGRQRDFVEITNRYDGLFPRVVGLVFDQQQANPGPCDRKLRPATHFVTTTATVVRVPSPLVITGDTRMTDQARVFRRRGFPVAATPENDLRFPSSGNAEGVPAVRMHEKPAPLEARRVPGVTAMPYERLGVALAPGWNGVTAPSAVAAADLRAPAGTLWARMTSAPPAPTAPSPPAAAAPAASVRVIPPSPLSSR